MLVSLSLLNVVFFQQKHVYMYIIDLFTGYDDDSKLNVTRDSNYYTMTWKSKIVKKNQNLCEIITLPCMDVFL